MLGKERAFTKKIAFEPRAENLREELFMLRTQQP